MMESAGQLEPELPPLTTITWKTRRVYNPMGFPLPHRHNLQKGFLNFDFKSIGETDLNPSTSDSKSE